MIPNDLKIVGANSTSLDVQANNAIGTRVGSYVEDSEHRYGASPEDWINFDFELGLTNDLLPVVSNPNLPRSPNSMIRSIGKIPSKLNIKGEVIGFKGWTSHQTTAIEIDAWSRNPNLGICIQTREVRAIDVDITDPHEAAKVYAVIVRHIPSPPMRSRPNSSKFLVAFRMSGELSKRRFSTTGEGNAIEFLANGQQFVAVGTHPSNVKYEWNTFTDFPVVTLEQFEKLWSELHETFATSEVSISLKKPRHLGKDLDIEDPVANFLEEEGLVLSKTPSGGLIIACPWEDEHTTGTVGDTSTIWLPAGTNGHMEGHFKCQHSHCDGRNRSDYLAQIGYTDKEDGFELLVQEMNNQGASFNVSDVFSDLTLQREDVKKMSEAEFLIPDMIVRGHVVAVIAPGNGGKTTLFYYLSEKMAQLGLKVIYINVDGSPGDLKRQYEHAQKHGYEVVAPDAKDGKSTNDVLLKLQALSKSSQRLDDVVFIIDTLKKFVDVISKRDAKEFYKLMRSLTVRGATICLLGHCNKYRDDNGQQIFEGTADLRNDIDELIYLNSTALDNPKRLEITTNPDKKRADLNPKSYIIYLDEDRRVVESKQMLQIMRPDVRLVVDHIREAILAGNVSQKDILAYVTERCQYGQKKVRQILHDHSGAGKLFSKTTTGRGRDLEYSLMEEFDEFDPG